jgi:hypothetical protein
MVSTIGTTCLKQEKEHFPEEKASVVTINVLSNFLRWFPKPVVLKV